MDLIQLKHYLRDRKIVPLQDVALHFKTDIESVRPLLETWMKKGKLQKQTGSLGACKGCCKCDPATIEIYEWIE